MMNARLDLAGVNLRMPNSAAWLFMGRALGANPTPMAFAEVYQGLQTGAIDGQDNPLPTTRAQKWYEVTSSIVLTGHVIDLFAIGCHQNFIECRRQSCPFQYPHDHRFPGNHRERFARKAGSA